VERAEPPLLLVLRALGLGDLLTALPALRALRRGFPDHELVLATPRTLEPLALLSGAVDRVHDAAPLAPLHGLRRPDLAVDLHGRGPESHAVLAALSPRRLVAFAQAEGPLRSGLPRWREDEHEVARWCRLVEASLGIPADPGDLDLAVPTGIEAPAVARGATLIHPGAAFAARRWPPERWAAVARAEMEAGREVVLTGGPGEASLAHRVAGLGGVDASRVLTGMDLLQLVAVVAAAGRLACGDTGVAHLATALRRPSVVLFGPVPPAWWGPPPRPIHRPLWKGRRGDPHGGERDPGLLAIAPGEVVEALRSLPAAEGGAATQAPASPSSSSRSESSSSGGTQRRSRSTQGRPRAASSSPPSLAARS
jgi:ADP-heptose:LPS heptosyltransferase